MFSSTNLFLVQAISSEMDYFFDLPSQKHTQWTYAHRDYDEYSIVVFYKNATIINENGSEIH